jgi:hypothetical protein
MSTVDIEIVALSLVSTSPITVTYDGGASSDMWDVAVDLSTVAAPMGTLTATKTYCNGGTYTSTLPVQPRFTFTPVGGGTPAVLDTGLEGMPPVILDQDDPLPWVSDVQPMFPLVSDPCTNFHPGIDDVFEGLPCDCNANGVMDSCDIESATARDCNVNARPDSCDIADGTSLDVDGNGFPDECPIVPPAIPLGDPSGLNKTRFISFSVAAGDGETALRIVLDTLHEVVPPYTGGPTIPFDAFEGEVRWVGAPVSYMESSASGIPFFASQLQCDPYYQDWSTVGLLHVTGSAITPSSIYEVEHLGASCEGAEAGCAAVAAPLAISTTRWGDVRTPYNPPDPSVQPDISDVSSLVDKFRNAPGAPIKARGFLAGAPGNPFGEITPAVLGVDFGFSHISACVDAFRGVPYPYTISACP